MPIYEYQCKECGIIEVLQNMNDRPLKKCPHCNSRVRKRISSGFGIIFKGNGFFETDYKRKQND